MPSAFHEEMSPLFIPGPYPTPITVSVGTVGSRANAYLAVMSQKQAAEIMAQAPRWPTKVLSLLDSRGEDLLEAVAIDRLILRFDDNSKSAKHETGNPLSDVKAIIDFAKSIRADDRVMIHCMFGISRGPSAALIVMSALGVDPQVAANAMREMRGWIRLNSIMLRAADDLLGLKGAMFGVSVHE
jgi:predicted protein tyrosine phosphatase